ncbi:hypothetical protein KFL_000970290 [Klebsormidium nitens]|uniref:Uncharacterized protein n=1 Tax=Klebsormidium nitens TaxID=105231 RepID=A0A0U9HJE9_KLENI|nr:hypothetical protein KFL_000970290 [Klebsormidium nitens]|eukprot:GAQ82003.1 hypothetical protein KFL_000970290 [Klebsormidium nitens]
MSTFTYKPRQQDPGVATEKSTSYSQGYADRAAGAPPAAANARHGAGTFPPSQGYAPSDRAGGYSQYQRPRTVGDVMVDAIGGLFNGLWGASHTVARVDLKRPFRYSGPVIHGARPEDDEFTYRGRKARRSRAVATPPGAMYVSGPYSDVSPSAPPAELVDESGRMVSWRGSLRGPGGARLKLMQIWDVASPEGDRPSFNFGAGVNFDMDSNRLTPKCRFKSDQVGLLLLPEPALELKGKWRVFDSPLAVDVKYQCPVTNFTRFWESPAKVRVRFFNANHAGLHITPVGVEFEDRDLKLGKYASLRVAAAVDFPRQLPLEEGDQALNVRVSRLGLKARIN